MGVFNFVSSINANKIPYDEAVRRGFIKSDAPANTEVFIQMLDDGKQVWVLGRNGKTYDAGVNDVPR